MTILEQGYQGKAAYLYTTIGLGLRHTGLGRASCHYMGLGMLQCQDRPSHGANRVAVQAPQVYAPKDPNAPTGATGAQGSCQDYAVYRHAHGMAIGAFHGQLMNTLDTLH
jgi:hypothetical protein